MRENINQVKYINQQNFPKAVEYAVEFNRQTTCNLRIRNVVLPIGCILFSIISSLFILGVLGTNIGPYNTFIPKELPLITALWAGVMDLLGMANSQWYWQTLVCLALIFVIPFAISSIAVVLIKLLTKVPIPSNKGNHLRQVNNLYEYCCKIPCTKKQNWQVNTVWCRISALCFVLLLVSYEIYALVKGDSNFLFIYLCIPIYFLFNSIAKLFVLTIKHYYKKAYIDTLLEFVPYTYVVSQYRAKIDPVIRKRLEENERAERAKQAREEREKKELEAKVAEAYLNGWPPNKNTSKSTSVIDDDPMGYRDGVPVDTTGM